MQHLANIYRQKLLWLVKTTKGNSISSFRIQYLMLVVSPCYSQTSTRQTIKRLQTGSFGNRKNKNSARALEKIQADVCKREKPKAMKTVLLHFGYQFTFYPLFKCVTTNACHSEQANQFCSIFLFYRCPND